jgi:hypothetical protein
MSKNKWQPIETAPKDETRILLFGYFKYADLTSSYYQYAHIGFYEPDETHPEFDWVILKFEHGDCRLKATYWMPLPNPPLETK